MNSEGECTAALVQFCDNVLLATDALLEENHRVVGKVLRFWNRHGKFQFGATVHTT